MKILYLVLISSILLSCDPVHDMVLENQTSEPIQVIYSPHLYEHQQHDISKIDYQGQMMHQVYLNPGEQLYLGTIFANYSPQLRDVKLDYLEVNTKNYTLVLNNKEQIFKKVAKVKSLDWRLIVKE